MFVVQDFFLPVQARPVREARAMPAYRAMPASKVLGEPLVVVSVVGA